MSAPVPHRSDLVAERLRPGGELLAEGRAMARDWRLGRNLFLDHTGMESEAAYKRAVARSGRIMQHAHIGFRSIERTLAAIAEVHGTCAKNGVVVDRFGITLDWSMGYPSAVRAKSPRGTGIVLNGPEDFSRITNVAPAAAHFGDFMLGLPGALENTRAAVAAGATAIGNLGQYFTFRLPNWDDDVATTEATVTALGLMAAQEAEMLVHSNLDDGFAGLFADMCSSIGMVLLERYIVEQLVGARVSHCYGHHFSAPATRQAFHLALRQVTETPGTMIFGNTVSYRAGAAGNYASLASYILADMLVLRRAPTGHAVNPVPVTENERIPDVAEIIDAQRFAARLAEHAAGYDELVAWDRVDAIAGRLVAGGRRFADNVLTGLAAIGIDTADAAQTMLAIRRMGPRRLEALYGSGASEPAAPRRAWTPVRAEWVEEFDRMADAWLAARPAAESDGIRRRGLKACVGTSDVHEHGKHLVERAFAGIGIAIIDGGVSADPDDLVRIAVTEGADFIAVSTYNGVALRYARELRQTLDEQGLALPVVIGGKLNQVPDASNSDLPVDVTADIRALGIVPCASLDDVLPVLNGLVERARRMRKPQAAAVGR